MFTRQRFLSVCVWLALALVTCIGVEKGRAAPTALAAPPNDDFAAATAITALPFTTTVDLAGATVAMDDPQTACSWFRAPSGYFTVWYRYIAPADGLIRIRAGTSPTASPYTVALWTGQRGALQSEDCFNNFNDGLHPMLLPRMSIMPVSAGVAYYIEVMNYWGGPSTVTLEVDALAPISPTLSTASSQLPGWEAGRLIDGNPTTMYSSRNHAEHLGAAEWVSMILNSPDTVQNVFLGSRDGGVGFPEDFLLQFAWDGGGHTCDPNNPHFRDLDNWQPGASFTGWPNPYVAARWYFGMAYPAAGARCVRVFATKLNADEFGYRYLQLTDFEVWSASTGLQRVQVAASSEIPGWEAAHLLVGSGTYSSRNHAEHLAQSEWLAAHLAQPGTVDSVRITPRQGTNASLGFPADYVIEYSWNGNGHTCDDTSPDFSSLGNWQPLVVRHSETQPGNEPLIWRFPSQQIECLRLFGTELSQDDYGYRYLQLGEVELFSGTSKLPIAHVSASSSIPGWGPEKAVDGSAQTSYSSRNHGEHLASSEWVAVIFPTPVTLAHLTVVPRQGLNDVLGFPKDFVIQYARNDAGHTCDPQNPAFGELGNWLPLASYFDVQPVTASLSVIPRSNVRPGEFAFAPQEIACLRLLGTELTQDDYGYRYLQLGELRMYGPTAQ